MGLHIDLIAAWICTAIGCSIVSILVTWLVTRWYTQRHSLSRLEAPDSVFEAPGLNLWNPQPKSFQVPEYQIMTSSTVSYLIKRINYLNFYIAQFAQQCRCNARSSYVQSLLCRLLITNVMLEGSPQWTLLSPESIQIAQITKRRSSPDAFKHWAKEKARVYRFHTLWPDYRECDNVLLDLRQEPPNIEAIQRLEEFIVELLDHWIKFDDSNDTFKTTLRTCSLLATRIGMAIHKDLRPWAWSFENGGMVQGPLGQMDDTRGELQAVTTQAKLPEAAENAPSARHKIPENVCITEDQIVICPALLAEGDESGQYYPVPSIAFSAIVI
ncbi:uncharacterized protein LY89DRAFT_748918 [Mollisia scopiformis]|uniref:Uncharacterized protein n=1 Tax=Mollisia scopiformis TaxID=149040 RepID=A0A194X847_MOLSC|nr:uncharacterized protein LY89DRAFT_748918 [Mollisia scopiformis]KUJ16336.1 hypothetical protein LY89DRAFT_748918 [Mollisia scopiformis]